MNPQPVIHNTFVIERSYPKPPETVFAAFADPMTKRRWFAAGEHHDIEAFESDFRLGGAETVRYRFKAGSPFPGIDLANEGRYQDIIPNRRIVSSSTMTLGDKRISASLVTIELIPTTNGTDLICTHQGAFFEGADGPEMREAGWRTRLENSEPRSHASRHAGPQTRHRPDLPRARRPHSPSDPGPTRRQPPFSVAIGRPARYDLDGSDAAPPDPRRKRSGPHGKTRQGPNLPDRTCRPQCPRTMDPRPSHYLGTPPRPPRRRTCRVTRTVDALDSPTVVPARTIPRKKPVLPISPGRTRIS